ncbi:hypothetical protein BCR41DRAFT_391065 [Lobosporangium transversale]|uniref:NAD(P)-binding domain-containing protein n=1 Tax=Lobosporangium transversale TaxID=64571 RepID=A0A1Y2H217_9FUNG|nr:hypothetical protein BCR41DRAFT_25565 [Lobosporangium transversale]XP_021886292.1 hypothetical protein BCR41DRAFT_391065 [Lobosporangium transversale]ORY88937.1 hypothetical protein BCR41DRAFT_25565 [Lobosporangium transversale]ORZ28619.1 hypothetical protein BCR41DRAFT_391065 [Lobosporangium transversale]|eukprot:XP_021875034.1 hypothetical protein BCR41DRAFT_25565 [Lobosporangium transversale]
MRSSTLPRNAYKEMRLAITSVDSWLGCCTAYYVAEQLNKHCEGAELVCLARKTDGLDKLKKLKNVKIYQVDYEDRSKLESSLQGVCCTILIPEFDERREELAKNVLDAMASLQIKGCIMVSVEGAGESRSDLKHIKSYHEIEEAVKAQVDCYIILREGFMNQCLLLWVSVIREKKEFPTSTTEDCEMAPLDMCDLICAISCLLIDYCQNGDSCHSEPSLAQEQKQQQQYLKDPQSVDSRSSASTFGDHKNKIYTLTGPQKLTVKDIVGKLSETIGEEIKVKEVERDELRDYFKSLEGDKDCREEFNVDHFLSLLRSFSSSHTFGAVEAKGSGDHDHRDADKGHHKDGDHRRHLVPNDAAIDLLLDELDLIRQGEAGFVSGDLEKITGHEGKTIKDFFEKEKEVFKPQKCQN